MYDFDSGWEIYDNGDNPAGWTNHREGRNMDAEETYIEIKNQLVDQ